jgi:iron complex transport system substrate-binding protein
LHDRSDVVAHASTFDRLKAIQCGRLHEIKSSLILQPGPAALTDGLAALEAIIGNSIAAPRSSIMPPQVVSSENQ